MIQYGAKEATENVAALRLILEWFIFHEQPLK
jgi:hypothetical protein